LIVSFGGCSRPSSKIVGKWQAIDANGRSAYEFFNDGSAMRRSGLDWVKGKWRFLDDGRLLVEATVFGTAVAETYDVTFDCETAIFKDSNGKKTKFSKVNDFVSLSDTEGNKGNVNVSADKEKWKSDIKKAEQKVEEKVKEFESKAK
jgi:hypothetical protein